MGVHCLRPRLGVAWNARESHWCRRWCPDRPLQREGCPSDRRRDDGPGRGSYRHDSDGDRCRPGQLRYHAICPHSHRRRFVPDPDIPEAPLPERAAGGKPGTLAGRRAGFLSVSLVLPDPFL